MEFPEWSDLGNASPETRNSWLNELAIRERYRYYYSGQVFEEKVPIEDGELDEAPYLYPVGLNLVKMLCLAMTDSEFGEWEDRVVQFTARRDLPADDTNKAAVELLNTIADGSQINTLLWETSLDRNTYGGGAIKVSVDLPSPGHIKWTRVPLESFFPIWDPGDPDTLLEVYVVVDMTAEQALQKYGIANTSAEVVKYVEHWTRSTYEVKVDGVRIDAFSGFNPYGFVPFTFIPRFRSANTWWGEALTEDLIGPQNELNMRVGDIGEAINYNSHPVRWGLNLPRAFNSKNFSLDPNAMWDLGRTLGQSNPPEVGLLEAKNPVPEGVFKYVTFLYDWSRTSSFAPPVAFGEDNGGGQRSGATLEIRMWPLIKATRRSRSYLADGILRLMKMSARMLQQKALKDVPARALTRILEGAIVPGFASIMPRDQQAIVDEVVKRMSTTPPAISLETAVEKLGDGIGEVDRIKANLEDETLHPKPDPVLPGKSNDTQEAMKGKETPQPKKEDA